MKDKDRVFFCPQNAMSYHLETGGHGSGGRASCREGFYVWVKFEPKYETTWKTWLFYGPFSSKKLAAEYLKKSHGETDNLYLMQDEQYHKKYPRN